MPSAEGKRVLSINLGTPRQVAFGNLEVATSIFKVPVEGRIALRGHNLVGDRQADLTVHGGPNKAVYLYPSEHYEYWTEEFRSQNLWTGQVPGPSLPAGAFGENLTTAGLLEDSVRIGDQFRIGSAVLQATQPRMPCYKLGIRFGRPDMPKRFWISGRSGIYFSVVEEGEMGAGDSIEKVGDGPEEITVAEVVRLFRGDENDQEKFMSALRAPLRGSWKRDIEERRRDLVPR